MKNRLLSGWNYTRILYTLVGTAMIIQSIVKQDWLWIVMGGYLATMGVFALGCAAGNGCVPNWSQNQGDKTKPEQKNIEFEEITGK